MAEHKSIALTSDYNYEVFVIYYIYKCVVGFEVECIVYLVTDFERSETFIKNKF
jgi:hypothetical protein